jgi:hypothetical protein
MRGLCLGLALAGAMLRAATAQPAAPPVENVTVNGRKVPDREIQAFVESRAAPTFRLGKMARWEQGICPIATGLKPAFLDFITRRLRATAVKVGAPVSADPHCAANIEIVFTTTPQGLMDNVRKEHRYYLGFHYNSRQADALAKVTHVIQAWYSTQIVDALGIPHLETFLSDGTCAALTDFCPTTYHTNGMRLANEMHSSFAHVIVVVDPEKLRDYEIGALADYIGFLALAQPRSQDECEPLPTIFNLLVRDCANAAAMREMTDSDLGYLRGLYHMTADAPLTRQENEIAFQVRQTLLGR